MHQTVSLLRRKRIFFIALGSLFICYTTPLLGQQASVELGRNQIGSNEQFTITLKIQNERLRQYSEFPQIPGFRQAGTSSSSSTNIVNGQISSSQSVIQTYLPTQEGSFRLAPFSMTVNEQTVNSPGTTITVGPPQRGDARQQNAQRGNPFADPFEDLFGQREPQEFIEVKDNAFLSLTTSKDEVYLGEGFTTTLGFYVSEEDQAPLQFPSDLGAQLTEILKKIKPSNAWEENFNIEQINGTPVTINGKRYKQYKVYQATFYPLNLDPIEFPSVPLTMIKYRVAKNPSFFGRRRQEDYKTFNTQPKTVRVKDLPPHPLKDAVAVGNYRLDESVSTQKVNTGSSFNYNFKVVGEGNISAIDKPTVKPSEHFEVYPPSVEQNITRRNGQVQGSKAFSYYVVPNEPGNYRLSDLFSWVYFNPTAAQYDTLSSDITLAVEGKSRKNELISEQDVGSFYDKISRADNTLAPRRGDNWEQLLANGLILSMLVLTAVVVFRR